jgi:hypothetical protein
MLSFEEHSGIIAFLLGIVILVMAAVGLSILVDKRFDFSSKSIRFERELVMGSKELEQLEEARKTQARRLADIESKLISSGSTAGPSLDEVEGVKKREASLSIERDILFTALSELNAGFGKYRADYRRKIMRAASGESLGDLVIPDGREYKRVEITRVTEVGLEIRHADGIARIQASDLDSKMQDRFLWKDEERRRLPDTESQIGEIDPVDEVKQSSGTIQGADENTTPADQRTEKIGSHESAELFKLRRAVMGWSARIAKLSKDQTEAQFQVSYGKQASVPGSLETWAARLQRIGRELAQAQSALSLAEAELAAFAPLDPRGKPKPKGF